MEHSMSGESDPATQTTATSTAAYGGQSTGPPSNPKQSQKTTSPGSKLPASSTATTQTPTGAMGGGKGAASTRLPLVPRPTRSVWCIHICPTTGGQFQLCASPDETIDGLKKAIAKKLKLTKERITLLNKERVLKEGSLRDNAIFEGCKLTLLPNIESGLMSQRPEHTVMQALENLSDIQVNDFLSGKSPLTLAMRLGDHMMFVQLQLSTSPPNSRRSVSSSKSASNSQHSSLRTSPLLTTPSAPLLTPPSPSASSSSSSPPLLTSSPLSLTPSSSVTSSPTSSAPSSPSMSPLVLGLGTPGSTPPSSPVGCLPTPPSSPVSPVTSMPFCSPAAAAAASHLGFSPFMLPPHLTPLPPHHQQQQSQQSQGGHHHHHHRTPATSTSHHRVASPPSRASQPSPCCSPVTIPESALVSGSLDSPPCTPPPVSGRTPSCGTPSTAGAPAKPTSSVSLDNVPLLDSSALAEASRNLSAKLKELSQASNVAKELKQTTQTSSKANGAIIESMQHHGQGIYSGTFSGTLNPALQDRDGKPKRSISTIVHILNDLLGATPQYRAQLAQRPAHPQAPAHRHHHHHHQHLFQQIELPHHHHHHHHHHHLHHAHRHQSSESPRSSRVQGEHTRLSPESRRLSQENRATRGKMEQIQQMLEERRVRRRARREARATPYGRGWASSKTATRDPAASDAASDLKPREQPMEVDVEAASNMSDVQEKAGYGELTQETVVA